VKELPNRLGSAFETQGGRGGTNTVARVPRGMKPPFLYPITQRSDMSWLGDGHVRSTGYVQYRGRICSVQGSDMSGGFRLSGFQKIEKPLENLINNGFGI
jgi:hypothetical protein